MKNFPNRRRRNAAVKRYRDACEILRTTLRDMYFPENDRSYWIGDDIGGLCDFGDTSIISASDIALLIEKNVSYDSFDEWANAGLDYNADKPESERKYINLKSWLMGARYEML